MDNATAQAKRTRRAEMRAHLVALSPAERDERSRRLVHRLVELPAWCAAARVLLFAPLPSEPDLDLLWRADLLAGKQAAYPRVEGMAMRLYYAASLDELEPTRWGLREPPQRAAREAMLDEVDLALVPGLAFDALGGRIGRGGGYYDRLLARRDPARTRLVGTGFAFQRVEGFLPSDTHDVRVDEVCTD